MVILAPAKDTSFSLNSMHLTISPNRPAIKFFHQWTVTAIYRCYLTI